VLAERPCRFAGWVMCCAGGKGRSERAQYDLGVSVDAHSACVDVHEANHRCSSTGREQSRANADPLVSEAVRHPHDSREMRRLLPKAEV
jgi:hypothetical protein